MGLSPLFSLHNIVLVLLVTLLRVNFSAFLISFGIFSGLSYLLSPLIVNIGDALLTSQNLQGCFTALYQFTLFKLAHWHHTFTLGALVLGFMFSVPLYFVSKLLIEKYRVYVMGVFEKFRIVKALKASKFYRLYVQYSGQSESTGGLL